jgi:putative membrane protein
MTFAASGQPPVAPADVWGAWNADPFTVAGILLAIWMYRTGRRRVRPTEHSLIRARFFAAALMALFIALISPLDALSGALASAHMVQHLILLLVAAPLLVLSTPVPTMLRGTPAPVRRKFAQWRRQLRLTHNNTRVLRHPGVVWPAHVGTLWFWHAAVPYDAALDHEFVHMLEHATFLLTGVAFWASVIGIPRTARASAGFGVLLMFATAMQGVFLSALLTFAQTPWYTGYTETTKVWGLDPLADQQLAGVIMWIPGGIVYILAALALLTMWIRGSEPPDTDAPPIGPVRYSSASPGVGNETKRIPRHR